MERAIRPRHLARRESHSPCVKGHAKLGAPERTERIRVQQPATGGHFDPMDRLLRHPLHYTTELKRAKKVRGFRQDAACEATWWEFASLAFRKDK